jgi:hypothetical protein
MNEPKQEKARWESYAEEIMGKDSAEMEAAVAEYARNRHESSSTQNKEELARWEEGNRELAKEYQWVKPEEYADEDARLGRILSYSEFISILRNKCGLQCFYREMGSPQKIALWVHKNYMTEAKVACWCQRPYMREWEVVRFDEKGVPLDSKFRGWRTCLLDLRLKEMLTEEQINKAFGSPTGKVAARYNQVMQSVRKNF